MTTDRDFDRQLGSWFESRATPSVPEGLLERSVARVDGTRQRPAWLVRDRGRAPRTMGRPATARAQAGRLLAAAVAVVVVAVGAGLFLKLSPARIGGPSSAPAIAPEPSTSVAPSSSPTPSGAGLPARAGQFDRVCDFGLASATAGWVSTSSGLYRTEDTGKTWSAVQPPGWSAATTTTSIFIDADTAYSFLAGSRATMAATHDGGASWVETVLEVGATSVAPAFSFQTPSSGSVTFFGSQLKSDPVRIYATADGGATWTGPKSGVGAVGSPWCGHQGLTPMLALTNPKYDNKPFDNLLQLSRDGGVTWSDRQLPVGAAAQKNALKWVTGLWADGSGRIVMAISVEGDDQVYTSGDDGRTWQFVKRWAGLHGPRIVQLLSATEWVFVASDASEVLSTADGGGHWRTTVGSLSFKLGSVSFASPDLAWASLMCGGLSYTPDHPACDPTGVKRVLLETTDGGRTWTPIGQ